VIIDNNRKSDVLIKLISAKVIKFKLYL